MYLRLAQFYSYVTLFGVFAVSVNKGPEANSRGWGVGGDSNRGCRCRSRGFDEFCELISAFAIR